MMIKDSIQPLALTSSQVLKVLNISRSYLALMIKRKLLTPLAFKKSHRLFAVSEIEKLIEPRGKDKDKY